MDQKEKKLDQQENIRSDDKGHQKNGVPGRQKKREKWSYKNNSDRDTEAP